MAKLTSASRQKL